MTEIENFKTELLQLMKKHKVRIEYDVNYLGDSSSSAYYFAYEDQCLEIEDLY